MINIKCEFDESDRINRAHGAAFGMDKFRIVFFDEIRDVSQIVMLYYLSLNWATNPEALKKMRRDDDRYPPEFGLYAVTPDGAVAGGVFLMKIPVETTKGKVMVGGISAVATRPGFQRMGIMTALVDRCHGYFVEYGLDYGFLTTAQTRVAHSFYEKMGYKDLKIDGIAWKLARKPPLPLDERIIATNYEEQNAAEVDEVFKNATENSYGFIYRPPNFLKARYDCGRIEPLKNMRLAKRNGKIVGYAYWDSSVQIHTCVEILALDKSSFMALLADAENRFLGEFLAVRCEGLVNDEIAWLRYAGYTVGVPSYGVTMVKSLGGRMSLGSMKQLFGVDEGLFRVGEWDST